jgi:hypothetical protein
VHQKVKWFSTERVTPFQERIGGAAAMWAVAARAQQTKLARIAGLGALNRVRTGGRL